MALPSERFAKAPPPGFTLMELTAVLSIIVVLVTIVILALNPEKHFRSVHNEQRRSGVALIADAIVEHARDEGEELLREIPLSPAVAIEACADIRTGSCTGLFSLQALIGTYLEDVPIDPDSTDPDPINEHSRYFLLRPSATRVTVSAPDTEPPGSEDIEVTR